MSSLADLRAIDVSAGRQRLDSGRNTLDRYRANELAEAEALSLARIKADTERALAHQAQALRDRERAAELVAIERRSNDLEAIKEAQRRQALDREAEAAMAARSTAELHAAAAMLEKKSVLSAARTTRQKRLNAEREVLLIKRGNFFSKISLAWVTLRSVSPAVVGLVSLLIGMGAGWLVAENHGDEQVAIGSGDASLKLATELLAPHSTTSIR